MARCNRVTAFVAAVVIAVPEIGSAQGAGHGHGVSQHQGSAPSASGAPAGTTDGVRHFGSWLDDASLLPEGQGALSAGFGFWKTSSYNEFDIPSVDGALGVHRRLQVGVSLPYFRANEPAGLFAHGVGDVYLSSKFQLRNPGNGKTPIGFAVSPIVEILSFAPTPGASRVSWALPVSVELRREKWRTYGSTGYFSGGSIFASGAFELTLSKQAWLTGTLSRSHALHDNGLGESLGLPATRTDVSAGLAVAVAPAWTVYGSLGRTLSNPDPDAATLALSGGVSWSFAAWSPQAPGRRR